MSTPVTFSWTVGTPDANPAPRASDEDRVFGRDIWFDVSSANGPDYVVDHTGDWLLVRGREALRQSLIRRFITNPGEWTTKPDYGAGLRGAVKAKNVRATRDRLVANIRAQALKDARVASVGDVQLTITSGVVKFAVTIVPKGETERAKPLVVAGEVT